MSKRLLTYLLIGIVGAFNASVCFAAEQGENVKAHQISGIVTFWEGTSIHVRYEAENSKHFVAHLRITKDTQITGKIEKGALVNVTFHKRRFEPGFVRGVALSIELIQPAQPQTAEGEEIKEEKY
jgi:hypothetical protein